MFSWYHRGPYSPTLTKELFRYESMGRLGADPHLTERERGVVARMGDLLGDGIGSARTLELYASLCYLIPRRGRYGSAGGDAKAAVHDLLSRKEQFDRKEADEAAAAILEFRRELNASK